MKLSTIPCYLLLGLLQPLSVTSFAGVSRQLSISLLRSNLFAATDPLLASIEFERQATTSDEHEENDNKDEPTSKTFESLGLSPSVLAAVRSMSWYQPTPIQQIAIPSLLQTSTTAAWCQAPTGSGKTAAFLLPLLHKILAMSSSSSSSTSSSNGGSKSGVHALLLVPTRELAVQVGAVAQNLCHNLQGSRRRKLAVQVVHGGVPLKPQLAALNAGADILIATPGRLVDLLTHDGTAVSDASLEQRLLDALDQQGKPNASLSYDELEKLENSGHDSLTSRASPANILQNVEHLILDEADRLLSRGFEGEMNSLLELLPPSMSSTWLFSATFSKRIEPSVDALLKRLHPDAQVLRISCALSDRAADDDTQVSARLQKRLDRLSTVKSIEQTGPASTIEVRAIRLEKPDRTQALRKLIQDHWEEWDRVLVFVGTRYASEHVARKLRRVGIQSAELHGKLDQEARLRRLNSFRKGRVRVLLATDVASRGLDVAGLPVVVNYDLPRSTEDWVHRIGRTGRANAPGVAVTFITPETEAHYDLIEKRHLREPVERKVLNGFEPNEDEWKIKSEAARISIPGADQHSSRGLAHDKMHGGIKGKRKSKKDRLREAAARKAQQADS